MGSMDPNSQHYSLNTHWNMCQFSSVFETSFPAFEVTEAASEVIIGVENGGGFRNRMGYLTYGWE